MKLFIVCKHPESNQSVYDLIDFLRSSPGADITVYGVQNVTQNKSRVFEHGDRGHHGSNIRFIDADDNGSKLDIDVMHRELTTAAYDVVIVIHTVNIVATIAKSIEATLETVTTKALFYCEIPREFPHRRYFDSLKSVVNNPKLAGRVRFATSSHQGLQILERLVTNRYAGALPYGITPGAFYSIPHDVARSAIELREDGTFVVFAVGRMDTSIMLFADFVTHHPTAKAKLLLPVDENLSDMVKEFYLNEMGDAVTHDAALGMLVLMKDIAFMNNDELNVIACSANAIVHANAITDFNIHVPQFALTNVPQIVPDIAFNTEYIDKRYVAKVNPVFDFYSFDDYGGRLSLCGHRDFSNALGAIYANQGVAEQNARALSAAMGPIVTQQLAWKNWRTVIDELHRGVSPALHHHTPSPPPATSDFSDEIDSLKKKLQNIMLKIK